jgi:hypothetical protein
VTVSGATEGYHSGEVGGIIPETFRVLRTLLNRINNPLTGILAPEFHDEILQQAVDQAEKLSETYLMLFDNNLEEGV